MNLKKLALWLFIGSIAVSAVLGIAILLFGAFGYIQERILLTTLTISATSICGLACGALWESKRRVIFPSAGAILALFAALMIIVGIWAQISNESFWRFSASVGLVAVATAHTCLLSLTRLVRRFSWALIAAIVSIYALAAELIYVIYRTPHSDTFARITGATSIVAAALSILMPLFHRLSKADFEAHETGGAQSPFTIHATITCPQCGLPQPNSLRETICADCGCKFVVSILNAGAVVPDRS